MNLYTSLIITALNVENKSFNFEQQR